MKLTKPKTVWLALSASDEWSGGLLTSAPGGALARYWRSRGGRYVRAILTLSNPAKKRKEK